MNFHLLATQVLDLLVLDNNLCFASRFEDSYRYYFCDWESLLLREISSTAYWEQKFGAASLSLSASPDELFSYRSSLLPDGGAAVLYPDSSLQLFRPDGNPGAQIELSYRDAPACDIAFDGTDLWFSATQRHALVQFSLRHRELLLRVGNRSVFPYPKGLALQGRNLLVSCTGSREIKSLLLPQCTLGDVYQLSTTPDCCYFLFGKYFFLAEQNLYVFGDTPTRPKHFSEELQHV